ncbi:hypothetical protein AX15_003414 [Amanita polypyramis BW_CC]|nr:hypothetical protein AX15_003414 [Amanita polypyramis BW_CC]
MKIEWIASIITATLFSLVTAGSPCKCLSYQNCWPSASEFSQLASQLSQSLIKPTPPASACYPPSHPSGNCTDVLSHLSDGPQRSNLPGAMQSPNLETYTFDNGTIDACYYNYTLGFPCDQGNIPILGVDARQVSDVQAAVKFSAKYNLRLVVKNTGHDYLGRSMARGAFMLWTYNLKNISYDGYFIPQGSPNNRSYEAITLGAGVQWYEAYNAVNVLGRVVVGGLSIGGSIGAAGGWIMGGGHSPLAPKYGLGADNAVQFTVVLASGQYVTANEYNHSDIFWALRGGGGGTYGVVVSVTYRTHEILPVTAFEINLQPSLADAGWGGYTFFNQPMISMLYVVPNETVAQVNATLAPFLDRASAAVGSPNNVEYLVGTFPSFYNWYLSFFNTTCEVGSNSELISRLVSRKIAEERPERVAELALRFGLQLNAVAGGTVSGSVGLLVGGISWDEGISITELNKLRQDALANLTLLDQISADSGTYFNEASLYEKNFRKTFFGSHYHRLKAIKRKYDVGDLFLVAEGVGSDDWDKSLNCRLH